MRVEIWHLEGARRGQRDVGAGSRVRIGTAPDAEAALAPGAGLLPEHAEIVCDGSRAHLVPRGTVRLDGRPVGEVRLEDGDVLEIGDDVRLRVRLVPEAADGAREFAALVARAPAPDREPARPPAPGRLVHGRAGAAFTALFAVIVVAAAWLAARPETPGGGAARERIRQDRLRVAQHRAYEGRIHALRAELSDLEFRMAKREDVDARVGEVRRAVKEVESNVLDRVSSQIERSLGANEEKLRAARDAVERIETADGAAERLIARYSRSVCLVQGSYGFGKEVDGEWRFLREATPELLEGVSVAGDKVPLMLEGDGPVFSIDYTGTAFLVDHDGIVLTNRHMAQPWWRNDAADPLLRDGYRARFLHLRAYFPGRAEPVPFDIERTVLSDEADLAALFFEPFEGMPEALVLAPKQRLVAGRRVLLLGYPSGLDALLARTEEGFARKVAGDGELEPLALLDALAARNLVRPLPTQGHVSDVLEDRVVFDAPTAVGGSGGPLLGLDGRVLAVNYGILRAFPGANFGVPGAAAERLMKRARSR